MRLLFLVIIIYIFLNNFILKNYQMQKNNIEILDKIVGKVFNYFLPLRYLILSNKTIIEVKIEPMLN